MFTLPVTISELLSGQQTTSRICVSVFFHFGHSYFHKIRLENSLPTKVSRFSRHSCYCQKKNKNKVVLVFFFTHTFSARSWLYLSLWTFCSVWGGLYLWCVTTSCAYCISVKEVTCRLTSFSNNALGCDLSVTKQTPHTEKLQIQVWTWKILVSLVIWEHVSRAGLCMMFRMLKYKIGVEEYAGI